MKDCEMNTEKQNALCSDPKRSLKDQNSLTQTSQMWAELVYSSEHAIVAWANNLHIQNPTFYCCAVDTHVWKKAPESSYKVCSEYQPNDFLNMKLKQPMKSIYK